MEIANSCFIVGGAPNDFSWGYDEEHPKCVQLREALKQHIMEKIKNHCETFLSDCSEGVGIWVAETILSLRKDNPNLKLMLGVPYEEQAARWPEEVRERYFSILEHAELYFSPEPLSYGENCIFDCHRQLVDHAQSLIVVSDSLTRNMKRVIWYAETLEKPILMVSPCSHKDFKPHPHPHSNSNIIPISVFESRKT